MTLLSLQAMRGYESGVKILLVRKDVNSNPVDDEFGRTPLSWAAERGHVGVVKMLLEREDICIAMPDNRNQTPLSLALSKGHDSVASWRSLHQHYIPYLNDEYAFLLANSDGLEGVLVHMGPVSKLADFNLPPTELFLLSQPLPYGPQALLDYPPRKTDIHLTNAQPTLPIVLARYFIIASFICLLVFPINVLPSSLPDIPSLYK
ncbi:hypothetical protein HOY82DRAFT_565015 [Tuber indicum]|nr:hypothetical protein HOY82DRAFT_565015 [Tuber indicum]